MKLEEEGINVFERRGSSGLEMKNLKPKIAIAIERTLDA